MKYCLLARDERHTYLLETLQREGNEVKLLARQDTGAWGGMVERAANLQEIRDWKPDVVLIDSPGFGPLAKSLEEEGSKVFGGSKIQDRLHDNYLFGMGVLETAGVPTIEHSRFTTVEDAVDYTQGKEQPWTMKHPTGKTENFPNTTKLQLRLEEAYAQADPDMTEFALQRGFPNWDESHSKPAMTFRPSYYLVGLFSATGLMKPAFRMTTAFGLLPEGQGIQTFEGVNLSPEPMDSELVANTLGKLQSSLKGVKYSGWVFLGVTEELGKKTYEWEPRVYDFRVAAPDGFWAAILRGLTMDLGLFLDRVLNCNRPNAPFNFFDGVVTSRKLTLPPYPTTEADWVSDKEKFDLRKLLPDSTFPRDTGQAPSKSMCWSDVESVGNGTLRATGPTLGYLVGRGESSSEAIKDIHRTLDTMCIPYSQIKVEDGLAELHLDTIKFGRC